MSGKLFTNRQLNEFAQSSDPLVSNLAKTALGQRSAIKSGGDVTPEEILERQIRDLNAENKKLRVQLAEALSR